MRNLAPLHELYQARLTRIKMAMIQSDTPVMLIIDPVNIRYATGSSNMPLFATRTPSRYLLLFAEGPIILYDYVGCEHLSKDLPTIDEIRSARGLCFTSSNNQVEQNSKLLAAEIHSLMTEYVGKDSRLAIDRFPFAFVDALRGLGLSLEDADPVFISRENKDATRN